MVIGIIGGGQLGLMIAEEAKKLNHEVIGLDPTEKCPLSYIADEMILADYNDVVAFENLTKKCDVLTYEFENVDFDLVLKYEELIPQKQSALHYSRNRLIEKTFAKELGIRTPRFNKYSKDNVFFPSIIKTTTGGYDGKGQWRLSSLCDVDQLNLDISEEYIIEEMIGFDYEISIIATRDRYGNITYYPTPINNHRNGILFTSVVSSKLEALIVSKAQEYTKRIIEKLDYVGTLAVEYFVRDGEVLFNEFAPRPHNSGHYTIEGCTVSQFENHVLAITGEKVKPTQLIKPTIMINVLGQDMAFIKRIIGSETYYHDYRKNKNNVDRKMGHITILSDTLDQVKTIKSHIIKE